MDLGLSGKVALVTGGSSGIGRACAVELAREGALVCAVGRDRPRLDETLALTRHAGREGFGVVADLSTEEGCRRAVEECLARAGSVDVLVNVAGAARAAPVLEMPVSEVEDALQLKLFGYLRLSQLVIPHMRRRRWGRIVNVAGAAGTSPTAENLPASFANVTILNLTRALTDEAAGDGILVNAVCPGGVDTPRARARWQVAAERSGRDIEQVKADSGRDLPAGRVCEADEVARVVCFLASEPCSYVFASAIYMDGGSRRATP